MADAAVMDPALLAQQYKEQLVQTADLVRDQVINLKQVAESTINEYKELLVKQREQLQPQALAVVESYKASVQDVTTPVPTSASPFLQKTYLWTAVCLFASSVAHVIGGVALGGVVGAIFDNWAANLLTFGALPVFVFMHLRKHPMSEMQREQVVLFGSVSLGALTGSLFSNRYSTIYAPPVFLLPLSIGLLAHYAGTKEQVAGDRRAFLGALMGGAVIGFLLYGFIFNFNLAYIASMAIVGGAAFVDLQLKLASLQRGDSSPQLEQWKTVVILSVAASLAKLLTSTTDQQTAAAAVEANKSE